VNVFAGLGHYGVECSDIDYVVCSHGHSDHTGNNNLFLNAKHIVGFSISYKDQYFIHPFETGELKLIYGLFSDIISTVGARVAQTK
jgi:glyoxylase-like metal-dependent hydrolase (beta-lactamase superfamily II)